MLIHGHHMIHIHQHIPIAAQKARMGGHQLRKGRKGHIGPYHPVAQMQLNIVIMVVRIVNILQ